MTQNAQKPVEAIVYAYNRTPTDGQVTPIRIADCKKIGARQFRDLDYLRECLEIVNNLSDDTIYLFDFSGQDLRGVDLANIELNGCIFRNCNLEGAEFGGAELVGADFTGANLRNAKMRNITAPHKEYILRSRKLASGQMTLPFDRYDFGKTVFDGADLSGADMTHARLHGARIEGANFTRARLDKADLSKASFSNTRFENAGMYQARISETTFTNSPLSRVQLKHAIGNAICHSRHEARRLLRVNRPAP